MLSDDDLPVAIGDARTRHAAVVDLIYFTDRQAMGLLSLYITLGVAAASGAVVAFGKQPLLPTAVGFGLGGATITLVIGAWFCFRAMKTETINLPGRGAEFWLWANHPKVDRRAAFVQYLQNLKDKHDQNNEINRRTSRYLRNAKLCGIGVPLAALASGAVPLLCGS